MKKALAFLASLTMCAASLTSPVQTAVTSVPVKAASDVNYAEALQKSMFFYEVQQAGILPEWNNVQWRADSMVKEDGTPSDIVDGGWFDAGDHYKFTLTNAYSASVMAWGYLQYRDAVDKAGLGELVRNNIQWGMDYVLGCDLGNGKMIGTIGDADDHVVWCSAEVYMRKHKLKFEDEVRPYDEITDSTVLALRGSTGRRLPDLQGRPARQGKGIPRTRQVPLCLRRCHQKQRGSGRTKELLPDHNLGG